MDNNRVDYLINGYIADNLTSEERSEFRAAMISDEYKELIGILIAQKMAAEQPQMPHHQGDWKNIPERIVGMDKDSVPIQYPSKIIQLWRIAAAVAAALLILATGAYLFTDRTHQTNIAEIKNTDSVVSTGSGEQREIILPDGTRVWLNAESSIHFPVLFADHERAVTLSGEAFFDVQHAANSPFIIHSGNIKTTVLGTAFDIKAYANQTHQRVAVLNGRVKVESQHAVNILEKGQQVILSSDSSHLQNMDSSSIAAWRTGNLIYKDETLEDIVADLQRVFRQTITIESSALKKIMLTISFNKKDGLNNALEILCRTTESTLSTKNGGYIIR